MKNKYIPTRMDTIKFSCENFMDSSESIRLMAFLGYLR